MTVEQAIAKLRFALECHDEETYGAVDVLTERIEALERIIRVRLGPGAVPTTSIHSGRPLYDDSKERP